MTKIDVNKTVELYDTRDGKTFASSDYSNDDAPNTCIWNLKVAYMGHGRIACSYGSGYCAYAVFVNGVFDQTFSTDFQLAKGSMGIRNAAMFEDKPVYHQTFEQSGVCLINYGGSFFSYELNDNRKYKYIVSFDNTGFRCVVAGCRRWDSFNEARNHYDENYDSDGNRHEVLKMLEVLEGWFDDAMSKTFPPVVKTDYERLKDRESTDGAFNTLKIPMSETTFAVKLDEDDSNLRIAIDFSLHNEADFYAFYWLKEEEVKRLRDLFTEVLEDWHN